MIIDEDILKDGIDEVLLAKLIDKHSLEQERYEKLYNYYIGKTIFNRLNIVSVRTTVRHRIAYKITFCNIHDILRVIAHNFVVRDIVA